MLSPNRYLLLTTIQLAAFSTAAQSPPSAIAPFVQHPTFCSVLLGGPDRIADGADKAFGEALATTTTAIGGPAEIALARIQAECAAQPATAGVPDRPKPRESL
ncbi:hypothetical protein [Variovorax paradoxus]|jgi:hypothetical protein|uniref:hypothetical protein n=1 Tax=Variovorax paradoxus TaxID=34073 RepID=UPI0030CCA6AA